jgi:fucose 4-O-acetylase-like acetyltransferase
MRKPFLDCIRGFGMVLVVFGHAQRGLNDGHLLPSEYPFEQIDFTLYTFHMPLFFLLSGLYVWPSLDRRPGRFLRSKFQTIVVPYFFWSIIQGGVQIIMSRSTNHVLSISDWPWLFYKPIGQFWFLYALMIWQLIALFCNRFRPALSVIAIAAFAAGSLMPESFFSTTLKMGVFLAAGAILGPELEARIAHLVRPGIFISCCVTFFLATYAAWGVAPFYSWQTLPAAALGIMATLIGCCWLNRSSAGAPFAFCGHRSMHIYVMHIMAVSGLRIVLLKAGVDDPYFMMFVCTAAGILLPLGVSQLFVRATDWLPKTRSFEQS